MKRRTRESGFAMLLVFVMAAAVAILLYKELPRVAFEAQRQRELMLIDRGEQYQRAIQLYFRKFRRFPASLDQLENTNNLRFLRRRYRDPITGKDEWRLIHIGPGGMLTDSLTQKPPETKTDEMASLEGGPAVPGSQELPSAVVRRRPSEMGGPLPGMVPPEGATEPGAEAPADQETQTAGGYPPGSPGQPYQPTEAPPAEPGAEPQVGVPYFVPDQPGSQPSGYPPGQPGQPSPYPPGQPGQPSPYPPGQPGQPSTFPIPVLQPGQPYQSPQQPGQPLTYQPGQPFQPQTPVRIFTGQPGQPSPVQIVPGFPGQPGQPSPGQVVPGMPTQAGQPGGFSPAIPQPGAPASSQTGGASPTPYPTGLLGPPPPPGVSPSPYQQQGSGGPANPALEMIRKILTTPRQGGLSGQTQVQETFTYGAGIVGVASKAEGDTIIVYNERSRYNEWEFIYDLRKDRTAVGPTGLTGAPAGTLLQPPQSPSTTTPSLFTPQSPAAPGRRGR